MAAASISCRLASFDPRPRVGGDARLPGVQGSRGVFRSTPPGGGRLLSRWGRSIAHGFRSTPPGGGRHAGQGGACIDAPCFDPRPRVGGDAAVVVLPVPVAPFRSTPPGGGRLVLSGNQPSVACFDPRPRVGGDRGALPRTIPPQRFDPRPRVGGDDQRRDRGRLYRLVSIHAPGWGATWHIDHMLRAGQVSIHAPGWGATASAPVFSHGHRVSIHAPGWGATVA